MKDMSLTYFRSHIYGEVEDAIQRGVKKSVIHKGRRVWLVPDNETVNKFDLLEPHNCILGDPEELVDISVDEWTEPQHL